MLSYEDRCYVEAFIASYGRPKVVSLSAVTHLFYFHPTDWRQSPVILVNKNGNYMRIMREVGTSKFRMVKTWNNLFDPQQWMILDGNNVDAEKVVAMISEGPGVGRSEMLSLFPKEAFPGRGRKAAYRQHVVDVWFDMKGGTFKLLREDRGAQSLDLPGKPWESVLAVNWCKANLGEELKLEAPGLVENPYEREAALTAAFEELEDNPLWGAFG
jgi:hypothetical protein